MVVRKLQSRPIDDQMQFACSRTWTALNRQSGKIDTVVVYKVDRLARSLADFAKLDSLVYASNDVLAIMSRARLRVLLLQL
jgi:hypothetical protein